MKRNVSHKVTTAACAATSLVAAMLLFGGRVQGEPATIQPAASAESAQATADFDQEHQAGMKWFLGAKFGMFIHWGLYSVSEGEWNGNKGYGEWFQIETRMPAAEYAKFADQFKPTQFDAKEWIRVVRDAGMKYIVMTSKHHDGFAMYDTKLNDYSVVKATPWHRDPLKELRVACKEGGVQFCLYYSLPDWHHTHFPARYSQGKFHGNPNPNAELDKYMDYMKAQIRELLTQYGPVGLIWFDDGGSFEGIDTARRAALTHAQEVVDAVHQLQPRCLLDDRLGVGSDYTTPEQWVPATPQSKPFEVCMPLNRHWGYNRADKDWKSSKVIIQMLVDIASKGGNLLLDVGPMANGAMPPEAVKILAEVGDWLKVNGEAIYGTTASPIELLPFDGRCTQKPGVLYLHVFGWPKNGKLSLPIANQVKRAYLLGDPTHAALSVTSSERGAVVATQAQAPDSVDSVIAVEIEGAPQTVALSGNLANGKPVEVSSVWPGREAELNQSHITDGKLESLWAAEEKARSAWVQVDLQSQHELSAALLSDAPYGRTQAFDLEAQVNGAWKKIAEGTAIGSRLWLSFPPVKAQLFRLNIRKASDTPTLAEFELFE